MIMLDYIKKQHPSILVDFLLDNIGGGSIYLWTAGADYYGKESNLTFSQKRQLFLELVEYYMKKNLLKFGIEQDYYNTLVHYKSSVVYDKNRIKEHEQFKELCKKEFIKEQYEPKYQNKIIPTVAEEVFLETTAFDKYFKIKEQEFGYKKVWDSSTNIEETIAYLDNIFPKNEDEFKEDNDGVCLFYSYCPPAYWWDEEQQEWITDD